MPALRGSNVISEFARRFAIRTAPIGSAAMTAAVVPVAIVVVARPVAREAANSPSVMTGHAVMMTAAGAAETVKTELPVSVENVSALVIVRISNAVMTAAATHAAPAVAERSVKTGFVSMSAVMVSSADSMPAAQVVATVRGRRPACRGAVSVSRSVEERTAAMTAAEESAVNAPVAGSVLRACASTSPVRE